MQDRLKKHGVLLYFACKRFQHLGIRFGRVAQKAFPYRHGHFFVGHEKRKLHKVGAYIRNAHMYFKSVLGSCNGNKVFLFYAPPTKNICRGFRRFFFNGGRQLSRKSIGGCPALFGKGIFAYSRRRFK